jgi:CheY-like chemotaxis protein
MPTKRILIVDDQRDIRQLLRTSLENLKPDAQIVDVPSGEEALLVISRQKFDLLVSDVRLAGMSGLELVGKVRKRNPGLKVILITGLTDSEVRQQVAEFGAEAFFYKPVDILEFRAKVASCLEMGDAAPVQAAPPAQAADLETVPALKPVSPVSNMPHLAEYLAELRQRMSARCVWIIDQQGETMLQAGILPEQWHSPAWRDSIIAAGAASATLLQSTKAEHPGNYLYFSGQDFDLHLVNLNYSLALLATTPVGEDRLQSVWMDQLLEAHKEIEAVLLGDVQPSPAGNVSLVEADDVKEEEVDEGELVELGTALQAALGEPISAQQADDFWDALAQGSGTEGTPGNSSLTYEQARKLGLTPEEKS